MLCLVSASLCTVILVYVPPSLSLKVTVELKILKFDCIIVDYLPTRKFPVIGQIAKWGLRAATVATLVGVYQFNTNDIGMFLFSFF